MNRIIYGYWNVTRSHKKPNGRWQYVADFVEDDTSHFAFMDVTPGLRIEIANKYATPEPVARTSLSGRDVRLRGLHG